MIAFLLRYKKELNERISLLAKQEKISRNKMIIKLIEIGLIYYLKNEIMTTSKKKEEEKWNKDIILIKKSKH